MIHSLTVKPIHITIKVHIDKNLICKKKTVREYV